ncbi:MAG: hypothetical protein ACYDDS_00715 [Candidatus Sulfotelmatobacter sp.]
MSEYQKALTTKTSFLRRNEVTTYQLTTHKACGRHASGGTQTADEWREGGGSDPKNDNQGGTAGTVRVAGKFVAFASIRRFGVGVDEGQRLERGTRRENTIQQSSAMIAAAASMISRLRMGWGRVMVTCHRGGIKRWGNGKRTHRSHAGGKQDAA